MNAQKIHRKLFIKKISGNSPEVDKRKPRKVWAFKHCAICTDLFHPSESDYKWCCSKVCHDKLVEIYLGEKVDRKLRVTPVRDAIDPRDFTEEYGLL